MASALFLAVLCTGCAVGQKFRYSPMALDLKASGTCVIAVSALDDRPYVKNSEKTPAYVGTLRGGFGNPWDVMTESGKPLSEDVTDVLCASLKTKGYSAKGVTLKPGESVAAAIAALQAANAKRLMLLTLHEWRSDTMMNTSVYCNLALSVMDSEGKVLAESKAQAEEESLGGGGMNPPGHAKQAVPAAFKVKLEGLLNDPAILEAMIDQDLNP